MSQKTKIFIKIVLNKIQTKSYKTSERTYTVLLKKKDLEGRYFY